MDYSENLVQVNTFVKGMNTDISDSMLDPQQYRYAENLRLNTNTDNNSGELRLIEGNGLEKTFTYTPYYLGSIGNYLVSIQCNLDANLWGIEVNDEPIFGDCHEKIWNDGDVPHISGVLNYESDDNIKLYFTDDTQKHGIMSINITKPSNRNDIEYISQDVHYVFSKITANVSNSSGSIQSPVVQYGYILYNLYGSSTNTAPVSEILSLYKNNKEGVEPEAKTPRAVDLSIDLSDNTFDRIKIYRIEYPVVGQLPSVYVVYDGKINLLNGLFNLIDTGTFIEQISIEEYLALNSIKINPKLLTSKDNYLFAANISYKTLEVDYKFKDIDTRSFSSGNKWSDGSVIDPTATVQEKEQQGFYQTHLQFDGNHDLYNKSFWECGDGIGNIIIGGKGPYIDWSLLEKWIKLSFDNGVDVKSQSRIFKHDETYRFGAILYDENGNPSSVKWIADIRIPPFDALNDVEYYNSNDNKLLDQTLLDTCSYIKYKVYYIKFTPHDIPTNICSGVEIVRCKRTIADKRILLQGICGFPVRGKYFEDGNTIETDYLFTPGFLSTLYMTITSERNDSPSMTEYTTFAVELKDILMFACPEYSYQPDDVKNIVNIYKNTIKIESQNLYLPQLEFLSEGSYSHPEYNNLGIYDAHYNFNSVFVDCYGDDLQYIICWKSEDTQVNPGCIIYTHNLGQNEFLTNYTLTNNGNSVSFLTDKYYYVTHIKSQNPQLQDETYIYEISENINYIFNRAIIRNYLSNNDVSGTYCFDYNNSGAIVFTSVLLDVLYNGFNVKDYTGQHLSTIFNEIKPIKTLNFKSNGNTSQLPILNVYYTESPKFSDYANGENLTFYNNSTSVGNLQFINWSTVFHNNRPQSQNLYYTYLTEEEKYTWSTEDQDAKYVRYPIGSGGGMMLLKLLGNPTIDNKFISSNSGLLPIHVANIVKTCTPYGGYTQNAIQNSSYYSFGNYSKYNGSLTLINVLTGDGFVGMFRYNTLHLWNEPNLPTGIRMGTVYIVPIESDIDLRGLYGDLYDENKQGGFAIQDEPASISLYNYTQDKPAYMYNTAYGIEPMINPHSPYMEEDLNATYTNRVHVSQPKQQNEHIDSWTKFKSIDYLDVSSIYGPINQIDTFKDRLIFWQEHAFGIISSNERNIVQNTEGIDIIMGTGDVLQRYDYVSTIYGMKEGLFTNTLSEAALYWWDSINKEIVQYNLSIVPMSEVYGIRNYLNKGVENTIPHSTYDNKYKEVLFSVVNEESVVYDEKNRHFSSIYTYAAQLDAIVKDKHYVTSNKDLECLNGANDKSLAFYKRLTPTLLYVVNKNSTFNKVFDILTFGGRLYGGDDLRPISITYKTPLKQEGKIENGEGITNREYDFRLAIPRQTGSSFGGRLRGKTMQCELSSDSNSTDFSLQYITTKYRISWS